MRLEDMTIRQARRIVRLRDEMRMTWDELAEFYGVSPSEAQSMYEWADLLVLHDKVLHESDLLIDIERQLLDSYNELIELAA